MLFRRRRSKYSFGEEPDERKINPVCSLCATINNVELKEEFDVYLCSKCKNNWN
jgi:NMD protein affecting ribosome stability and mRNA decay